MDTPYGLFVDSLGNLFVADTDNAVIREVVAVNSNTIQTVAGNGTAGYKDDGGASTSAELNSPIEREHRESPSAHHAFMCARFTACRRDLHVYSGDDYAEHRPSAFHADSERPGRRSVTRENT